ncbi:MAG TPA: hypothetical protein VI197_20280 [Polyangiaceae bacterium]
MSSNDPKEAERRARQELEAAHRALEALPPLIEQLAAINEQARALGIFVEDRPLLQCSHCGLTEDELANGQHVTYYEPDEPDTGLRFIQDEADEELFRCPACGAEVRLDPLDPLDEPDNL